MHEIHCIKHCHGQREHFSRIKALNAKISKSYKVSLHLHTPGKQSTGAVQLGIACVPRTRQFKISKLWNYSILHIPRICVAYYLDCACPRQPYYKSLADDWSPGIRVGNRYSCYDWSSLHQSDRWSLLFGNVFPAHWLFPMWTTHHGLWIIWHEISG